MRHASIAPALLLALVGCGGGSDGGGGEAPTPVATLSVSLAGAGTGSVTSAPAGIACAADCAGDYSVGTEVTLTATPAPGSVFTGWSGGCQGTAGCTVKVDAARNLTATFARAAYQLAGRVSGLDTPGLVLKSGAEHVTLDAGASSFTFGSVLQSGSAYEVVVEHQPQSASCTVANGSGIAGFSDVTAPMVSCVPLIRPAWRSGAKTIHAATAYGTLGQPSPGAAPGARTGSLTWTTTDGLVWLYGGRGVRDSDKLAGQALSDLWTFDVRTSQWAWRAGSAMGLVPHVATAGTADPAQPGSRNGAATWVAPTGELWLFGGETIQLKKMLLNGFTETPVNRNDLWTLNRSTLAWTWMGGSQDDDSPGRFETRGIASTTALPPARSGMSSWVDAAGNLWIFGGVGSGAVYWSDLWKFTPATRQWTWVAGPRQPDQPGTHGTLGLASEGNAPGGRSAAFAWRDNQGRLCLYGGGGRDANGAIGLLSDLWCFDTATSRWTWLAGSSLVNAPPVFGERGTEAPGNTPGGRLSPAVWLDDKGRPWLYGGSAFGAQGQAGFMADLWRLDPATSRWTWVSGPNDIQVAARHGELGTAAAGNWPGSRLGSMAWTDGGNGFWLFGGYGYDDSGAYGPMNDVWQLTAPH